MKHFKHTQLRSEINSLFASARLNDSIRNYKPGDTPNLDRL